MRFSLISHRYFLAFWRNGNSNWSIRLCREILVIEMTSECRVRHYVVNCELYWRHARYRVCVIYLYVYAFAIRQCTNSHHTRIQNTQCIRVPCRHWEVHIISNRGLRPVFIVAYCKQLGLSDTGFAFTLSTNWNSSWLIFEQPMKGMRKFSMNTSAKLKTFTLGLGSSILSQHSHCKLQHFRCAVPFSWMS